MASMLASIGVPKNKRRKQKRLTVIELSLFTPTPTRYTSFDYEEIKQEFEMASEPDEDDPLVDHDALEIVKRLEAKYGASSASNTNKPEKRSKKIKYVQEDVMDKGIGYDLEDAFIDDSEAYDEWVPSTMDTAKSGYYVNKGVLEFRHINSEQSSSDSSDSEVEKVPKKQLPSRKAANKEQVKRKKKKPAAQDDNSLADISEPIESSLACEQQSKFVQQGLPTESTGTHQIDNSPFLDRKRKALCKPVSRPVSKSSSPNGAVGDKGTPTEPTAFSSTVQPPVMKTISPKTHKPPNIVRLSQGGAPPTKNTNMFRLSSQRGVPPTRKMAVLNSALARARDQANAKEIGGRQGSSSPKSVAKKMPEKDLTGSSPISNSQLRPNPSATINSATAYSSCVLVKANEKTAE